MNPLRASLAFVAAASALLFSACTSPQAASALPTRDPAMSRAWVERRAAELAASGIPAGDATLKARAEFASRFGYQPENYPLYDSGAKARAEQQKVNDGLEKLQRDRGN